MLTANKPAKTTCTHCAGMGSLRSSVSRTYIKCRVCRGTGSTPRSLVLDPEIQRNWISLDKKQKQEVTQRLQINPNVILKPWWNRIFYFPYVWWKNYKISTKNFSFIKSIKSATLWTMIIIYPNFALKIIKRKLKS